MKSRETLYRSAVRVALGVAFVLSLPLVAMLFTDDVVWSLADFVAVGVLCARGEDHSAQQVAPTAASPRRVPMC